MNKNIILSLVLLHALVGSCAFCLIFIWHFANSGINTFCLIVWQNRFGCQLTLSVLVLLVHGFAIAKAIALAKNS